MRYQFLQSLDGMYVLQYDAIVQPEDNSIRKCRPEAGTPGTLKPGSMNIYLCLASRCIGRQSLNHWPPRNSLHCMLDTLDPLFLLDSDENKKKAKIFAVLEIVC